MASCREHVKHLPAQELVAEGVHVVQVEEAVAVHVKVDVAARTLTTQ